MKMNLTFGLVSGVGLLTPALVEAWFVATDNSADTDGP